MTRDELQKTIAAREAGAMPDQRATTEQLRDLVDVANTLGLFDSVRGIGCDKCRGFRGQTWIMDDGGQATVQDGMILTQVRRGTIIGSDGEPRQAGARELVQFPCSCAPARRSPAPTRPLVFAIRPEFCDRILAGPDVDESKGWEFRTRAPSLAPGEVFLIYKTAPVSMVVGYARRGQLLISDPATIWTVTDPLQGIARSDYDAYFDGREKAVAIEVVDATLFDEPLALPAGMSAPQSWSRWKGDWPLAGVPC